MIDKIIELFEKGYCNDCNELNCLGGEPSSKMVAKTIKKLQQENDTLKQTHDYDLKMIDEVKCNSSKVLKENRQLKEQLDQATKSTINSHRYASNTEDRLIELEEQLKQRDEVIDEAIKKTKVVKEHKFDLIGRQEILETLQKYKGDNNE